MNLHKHYWNKKIPAEISESFAAWTHPSANGSSFTPSNGTISHRWEVLACDQSAAYYFCWAWPKSSSGRQLFLVKVKNSKS